MENQTEGVKPIKTTALFGIGDRVAFSFGVSVEIGKILAINGENHLIKHRVGLDIFSLAELAQRQAVRLPRRIPFWKRLFCIPNVPVLARKPAPSDSDP